MLPTTDTEPHLNQTLVWQAFAWSRPHPLAHPRPCHLKDIDGANIQAATTNLDAARDASQTASASMQRTRLSSGPCHKLRPPGPCIVLAAPGRPWVSPGIWQAHTESHQREKCHQMQHNNGAQTQHDKWRATMAHDAIHATKCNTTNGA